MSNVAIKKRVQERERYRGGDLGYNRRLGQLDQLDRPNPGRGKRGTARGGIPGFEAIFPRETATDIAVVLGEREMATTGAVTSTDTYSVEEHVGDDTARRGWCAVGAIRRGSEESG